MFDIKPRFESKNFQSFAKNLKSSISNMTPPFDEFGRYLTDETKQQFTREEDPEGNKWAELSPRTLLKKKSPHILRETEMMYKSLYYRADKKSFEYGINDFKYNFHHTGTERMPARVVIGITETRKEKLNKLIILYLKRVRSRR
jgi:hypothetical protein